MLYFLLIPFFLLLIVFIPGKIQINVNYDLDSGQNVHLLKFCLFFRLFRLKIKLPCLDIFILPLIENIKKGMNIIILKIWPGKGQLEIKKELDLKFFKKKQKKRKKKKLSLQQQRLILKKLKIINEHFSCQIDYGLGNPAFTGFSHGVIWILLQQFVQKLSREILMTSVPELRVTPVFDNTLVKVEFEGIFIIYPGNIIITGFKIASSYLKGGFSY